MQLLTDWNGFISEIQNRWPKGATVFLARDGRYTVLTASDTQERIIFRCKHAISLEEAKSQLESYGHTCHNGVWSSESDHNSLDEIYIAAVAYQSDEKKPGLWVDIYSQPPTVSGVLAKLIQEFNSDGTLNHADNESFQKIAHPNIVILTPQNIQHFVGLNQDLVTSEASDE